MIDLKAKMQTAKSENPFYGKAELWNLYQSATAGTLPGLANVLSAAWKSCRNVNDRTLFWQLVFAAGDIPNREHNAFRGQKIEQGGSGHREWFKQAMAWARKNETRQYERFVISDVIRQYTNLDNIIGVRVKTKPGTTTVTEIINPLAEVDIDKVADYLAYLIRKSNPAECVLIAKFLSNVKTSRQKYDKKTKEKKGTRKMQPVTVQNMAWRAKLYGALSEKMGWEVFRAEKYSDFKGLKAWKAQFNGELESVLFSTGKIKGLDKIQFFDMLEKSPAGARYRIRRRLLDKNNASKGKWISATAGKDFAVWYLEWEKSKEKAQEETRVLTEKVRQGLASEEDKAKLVQVQKAAKVNVGGTTLIDELEAILTRSKTDREVDVSMHSILEMVKFEVPVLGIVDVSSSMNSGGVQSKSGRTIRATDVAALLTTILMTKNPSNELDDILIRFGSNAEIITNGASGTARKNRFLQGQEVKVKELIDRSAPFTKNLENIRRLTLADQGSTRFDTVAGAISSWIESDRDTRQHKIEQLQGYPVFVVVSDGDMNSSSNAATSMMDFRRKMLHYGWDGVVVIWDVNSGQKGNKFDSIPNTMQIMGWNLSIINQVFTKIHDLDVIDTFLPLKTLWESNRYELVKKNVI